MSDDDIPELDLPPPPPPPRPSAPGGVRSAARAQPLPEQKKKLSQAELREGVGELFLNAFGMLKEMAEDFRSSDRFFKYKAFVMSGWLVLSVTSVGVACPGGSTAGSNELDARLVLAGDESRPVYMVKNDSEHEWQDVEIIVNGNWRTTAASIPPNGDVTLSPRLLIDAEGQPAKGDMRITEIDVRTSDGEATLLHGGRQQ